MNVVKMQQETSSQETKSVANATADLINEELSKRKRNRAEIIVRRLKHQIQGLANKEGVVFDEEDFLNYFKQLESFGWGSLIRGRGRRPTVFRYNYSLKEVTAAAKDPNSPPPTESNQEPAVEAVKRRPGRPKGSTALRKRVPARGKKPSFSADKPLLEIVLMTTTLNGEYVPVTLKEAEKLAHQVALIKGLIR